MSKPKVKIEIPKDIYEALNPILALLGQDPLVPKEPKFTVSRPSLYWAVRGPSGICHCFEDGRYGDRAKATALAVCDLLNAMEEEG